MIGLGTDGQTFGGGGGGGGGGLLGGGGGGGCDIVGDRDTNGAGGGGGGSSYAILTATNVTFATRTDTGRAGSVIISTNILVSTEAQLRQAIQNANDGDTITLTADITLTSDLPPVLTNVTLQAGNHVLDGASVYRILFAQGGTLTLGAIQLAHGDVVIGSGTTGGIAGSFTMSSGTNLRFDRSDDLVFDATLFGDGTITQEGTGVLTINGSNTFTGNLVVKSGGTVKITQANPAYPQITNDGVVIFDSSSTSNYLGVISGSGVVAQSGAGVGGLTLGAMNSYSGGTTFLGGSMSLTSLDHFGTGPLVFDGGALQWSGSSPDISVRPVTMNSDGRIDIPQATTVTFANAIGNGGPGGITKVGDGTLVLLASTSYTGETDLEGGTLRLGPGVHIGPVSLLTANNGGNFVCDESNVIESLTVTSDDIGLRVKLGPNTQVPAISGAFTNAALQPVQIPIDLIPSGVLTMGQAYTLLTYDSTNLQASDFVPVSGGTFVVEPHALKFKLDGGGGPAPARHGVAVKTARGRNRVTYTVTNTGEVNAVFRIAADITMQSSLREARLLKRSVTITTLLDGGKAPKSLTARGASVPLAPGGKARIDIKVATRGKTAGVPAVRTTLQARDLTTPGISDRAQAVIKP
jgi:autotransporter-associated beta strand protein